MFGKLSFINYINNAYKHMEHNFFYIEAFNLYNLVIRVHAPSIKLKYI